MLRSASSERAAAIGREQIENHYLRTMIAALPGDLAAEGAALVFAIVAGVQVMRQMIGLTALADADPDQLVTFAGAGVPVPRRRATRPRCAGRLTGQAVTCLSTG